MADPRSFGHPARSSGGDTRLYGRRVMLRPLIPADFASFSEVRIRNEHWLLPWEPKRIDAFNDPTRHRDAFSARCAHRDRERQAGSSSGFGVFVDHQFAGEINLNNVVRGAMQSATVGYWIDQARAGHRYIAEGFVALARHAFEDVHLHRLEIGIVPRNTNSRRVMETLAIREEGVAQRLIEIDGTWEDHVRYGITIEEWQARRTELSAAWLSPQ